jgi:SAM-dependent methyltransferase
MTTSKEIIEYYDCSSNRKTRDDLKLAVKLVDDFLADSSRVAVDCGCGAGSDIAFLRSKGFLVYAFDSEPDSIARCRTRFNADKQVILSQATFSTFNYPRSSLVVADASLYFCPEAEFSIAWHRITESLLPGGIFFGSFLGPEDSMADPDFVKKALWSKVLVSSEEQVKDCLNGFEIINFTEYRTIGESIGRTMHDWHIFSVVARKEVI